MSQQHFNFRSGDLDPNKEWGPPGRSEIYISVQDAASKPSALLAYCREDRSLPATAHDFLPILYFSAYQKLQGFRSQRYDKELILAFEERYLKKVKQIISLINNNVLRLSNSMSCKQDWLNYLWQSAELIIPVGKTESGEFLRDYHGPGRRQPVEVLNQSIELLIAHREKQSQSLKLLQDLKVASAMADYGPLFNNTSYPSTLTTSYDTPDEAMDQLLDEDDNQSEPGI